MITGIRVPKISVEETVANTATAVLKGMSSQSTQGGSTMPVQSTAMQTQTAVGVSPNKVVQSIKSSTFKRKCLSSLDHLKDQFLLKS